MESHNICDYSLLVGIHRVREKVDLDGEAAQLPSSAANSSIFRSYKGGIASTVTAEHGSGPKEIFFVGLIDTLTEYNFNKKAERALKSFLYNKNEISAIPPRPYRTRFQKYATGILE